MMKRGASFSAVVITCTFPPALIPNVFIHVSNQILESAVTTAAMALVPNIGTNKLIAPTKETAIVALVAKVEIRYPHATRNPGKSPHLRLPPNTFIYHDDNL